LTTDFAFIRYIGHLRMEVNDPFLDEWAKHIAEWLTQGITVYAFCHCPFTVHAPTICSALYERVNAFFPLPPLAWKLGQQHMEVEQGRLF
jgi:uncharacterized protein YecE (DUF72 family)